MRFSENLRALRQARGLSQFDLAKLIGSSQSSITAWECETREPDFKTIQRLADFFQVPMSALLPSDDTISQDYVSSVAEALHQNQKLKLLFDHARYMSEKDLDAVLMFVSAIQRKQGD